MSTGQPLGAVKYSFKKLRVGNIVLNEHAQCSEFNPLVLETTKTMETQQELREFRGSLVESMFMKHCFAMVLSWGKVPTALVCLSPSPQVQFYDASTVLFIPGVILSPDPLVWQCGLHLGQLL
jgi:hypothetical protein